MLTVFLVAPRASTRSEVKSAAAPATPTAAAGGGGKKPPGGGKRGECLLYAGRTRSAY